MTHRTKEDHLPDKIGGPTTKDLAGRTFEYQYSSGIGYRLSFDEENVYFIPSDPPEAFRRAGKRYLSLPYRARSIRDGLYLVHWLIAGRSGHVTLIIDLERQEVHSAALMPGKFELFDIASIDVSLEKGDSAIYKEPAELT